MNDDGRAYEIERYSNWLGAAQYALAAERARRQAAEALLRREECRDLPAVKDHFARYKALPAAEDHFARYKD